VSRDIALAIIGGSGLYALPEFQPEEVLIEQTPYGAPSGPLRVGLLFGARVVPSWRAMAKDTTCRRTGSTIAPISGP
jgi:purine nucleoside phosphorylase